MSWLNQRIIVEELSRWYLSTDTELMPQPPQGSGFTSTRYFEITTGETFSFK